MAESDYSSGRPGAGKIEIRPMPSREADPYHEASGEQSSLAPSTGRGLVPDRQIGMLAGSDLNWRPSGYVSVFQATAAQSADR